LSAPLPIDPPVAFTNPVLPHVPEVPVSVCALCGAGASTAVAAGWDYEYRSCANRWTFVRCDECAHVRLHPRPSDEALSIIYPPHYYAYKYDEQIHPVARRAKAWLDQRKFAGILRFLSRPPRGFLDVGCGDGRFLDLMANRGVPRNRCWGLELDAKAIEGICARGLRGVHARVEDCDEIPAGSLDLATMFHVIEHVADPAAVVRHIAKWLAPGGVLAMETPNLDSWDARRWASGIWGGYHIPRHWHLFTPETLLKLARNSGLEPVALTFKTGHAFWLWSLHHLARYGTPPRPRLAACFSPVGGSLPLLAGVTAWDLARAALGFRTSAMLLIARRAG
jgi:2-polyprenyl-3-methyl-5-hydroxy-6-metoxy-1,4-benzoquinol methylase